MRLFMKNETGHIMEFCCGEKEYVLKPGEEFSIEANDEDCVYFDEVRKIKSSKVL